MKRPLLSLFALSLFLLGNGQSAYQGPAFLDGWDEVRVWLPEAAEPAELKGKVAVRVAGKAIPVRAIEGGEPANMGNDPNFVTLPGTLQAALGATEWNPAGRSTQMARVADGIFELVVDLPAGIYQYKIARGGSWAENYGAGFQPNGGNLTLANPVRQLVRFRVDFGKKSVLNSVEHPGEVEKPASVPPRPPDFDRAAKFQSVKVRLARKLKLGEVGATIQVQISGGRWRPVFAREVLSAPEFRYPKDDLGARWTPKRTTFKVWSPAAASMGLVLFSGPKAPAKKVVPMKKGPYGVWEASVPGNLHGTYYQYRLVSYRTNREAADVNGFGSSSDSSRSLVLDLAKTNPRGWPAPRPFVGKKPTDAVIYEAHVRDLTIHPQSGIKPEWRGKYLGLSQAGTTVSGSNFPSGLDYLKALGATHLHLLPFQDFNPGNSQVYNWGYETTLFNVPEEQYATNREDGVGRIREVKQMVLALQKAGIGVVMDVVYNHSVPSEGKGSAFWELAPYYYFRTNDRGDVLNESGVGNALNDERPMVRKYISDSLAFWAKEYRIDGFRFDLVGMFTKETNRHLASRIRQANPHALVYGEPWTGGGPTRFGKGDQRGTGMAVFNDQFRNAIRGELDGPGPGFSMGGGLDRGLLETIVRGSTSSFADSPLETVNYVSAHDNLTFRDKVALSMPGASLFQREAAVRLAHATVLLSQGIPFLEGGVEIGRTKGMNPNSYNAGDSANQFDWLTATAYRDSFAYFQGLIALRKAYPAFRLSTKSEVDRAMTVLPGEVFGFRLSGKDGMEILVYLHGGLEASRVSLPDGEWDQLADGQRAGVTPLRSVSGEVEMNGLSAAVFVRKV